VTAAEENRRRKAWALAPALYRRGLTLDDLRRLPYSSRDRTVPTQRAFARTAYDEAGVDEAEPHGPDSDTWTLTIQLLAWMEAHPGDGRVPPRDRLDDRARWSMADTCAAAASLEAPPPPPEPPDGPSSRPSAAADVADRGTYHFPRSEGAACLVCSTWHRRYGTQGGGALCPACRQTAHISQGEPR
jgi:hypothetical protein